MATPLERSIESYLYDRVLDTPHTRILKMQRVRGWPDRLIFIKGKVWLVEVKRPKGWRYEPLQARIGAWLVAHGYNYVLLKTRDEVDKWLRGL